MKTPKSFWSYAMCKLLLVAVALLPSHVFTYKVLMVPLTVRKSHVFTMAAMADDLVNRGHKVTFFIGENFPLNLPELRNRADLIGVVSYKDTMDYNATHENLTKSALASGGSVLQMIQLGRLKTLFQEICRQMTTDNEENFDKLEREKFDVAVVDGIALARCVYLIPHRLQIPWITYTDGIDPLLVRVPWPPSFVPNFLAPFSEQISFTERLQNTAMSLAYSFTLPLFFSAPAKNVQDQYKRYGTFSSLDELASKSVLWFMTVDNVLDYPRTMMPNMISVAGLTAKRSMGDLPPDIKGYIDGAEKGVILMTFGSMASTIQQHMVEKFSSAFRRLDGYRVIWRLENEDNVELPDNVMIRQWLPQNDILAHPSVKLFITHCGNNGQHEAVYHAVPMIGFPLAGDQMLNAKRLDYKGFGLSMNLFEFTADELFDNVKKILGDKSYKERVTKASEIFRSQAQSPVERATFWIEHVCRFGGDHLRSAGNDLPLHSYLMLDILALFLFILHILVYVLYKLLKFVVKKYCRRKDSNEMSKKNI